MKFFFPVITFLSIIFCSVSFADSPITSTTFYEVYLYNSMIDEAKHCGYMSKENAKYLNNDSNPVEMKAALINALGWDESGKNNANLYSKYIYGKNWDELDLEQMSAPQLMVLGYLVVMDDYFKPEVALPILEKALQKDKYSYTINVIHSLIKAQLVMNEDFCEVWKVYYNVNSNKNLLPDLTPQAKEIIYNYMLVYKSYCQ